MFRHKSVRAGNAWTCRDQAWSRSGPSVAPSNVEVHHDLSTAICPRPRLRQRSHAHPRMGTSPRSADDPHQFGRGELNPDEPRQDRSGNDRNCQGRTETRRSADGRSRTSGPAACWSPRQMRCIPAGTRTEISCRRRPAEAEFRSGSPRHEAERGRDRDRHPRQSARCLARFHRRADRDHDVRRGGNRRPKPTPRSSPSRTPSVLPTTPSSAASTLKILPRPSKL